jgi:N-methylhydantoinase B/oxoprolinase/acetone carboxylase alpha subunit
MSATTTTGPPADAQSPDEDFFAPYRLIDPVMFQVIGDGLVSICREMGTTMCRTAYSPIFVDGLDFSCGILDARGEMIAQAEYCPVHLNSMGYSAAWAITEIGIENLDPGDVILHNDPYRGGTHLNDVNCIKPLFVEGTVVAIGVNRAHHIDLGGKARAGFAGDATDLFTEGLIIPPVKWWRKGREDPDIGQLIYRNVRQPYVQKGDFSAQVASCITAERRLQGLCEKYGSDAVLECFEALKDYAERRMRAEIAAMPDGSFSFSDFADDDGISTEAIEIHATVEIEGDSMKVDFTGSNSQVVGPINATFGITSSACWNAIMQVTDPTIPINEGRFRPVELVLPRGSVVNAENPRPTMGGNAELHIRICETVMGCFAQVIPDRVIAACYGCVNNFTGGAIDPETGDFWIYYLYSAGGWGARQTKDGWDEIYHQPGNGLDYPVEILETQMPIRYLGKNLSEGYAGAGRFRGGFGARRVIEYLEESEINAVGERHRFGGWGLYGGRPARPNAILLKRLGEDEFRPLTEHGAASPSKFSNVTVRPGDQVALVQSGGGGYGNPYERDLELVLSDLEDELISFDQAREQYGVVARLDGYDVVIDAAATDARRVEMAAEEVPNVIAGCITVDPASATERTREHRKPPIPHPDDLTIASAQESLDFAFCRTECPKRADAAACPFHNQEALAYWSPENLNRWAREHCPQKSALTPHFRVARIY